MEIETNYGVDVWYSGSHVGIDGLYWNYKDANDRFLLRVYWCGQRWCNDIEARNIDLVEHGHLYYKYKWEAENAIIYLKKQYPNHTISIHDNDDWNKPYYVLMCRTIKTYDWKNKMLTCLGRTFEKEDEPVFVKKKAKIMAKLNEVTKLHDLAFEVENGGE